MCWEEACLRHRLVGAFSPVKDGALSPVNHIGKIPVSIVTHQNCVQPMQWGSLLSLFRLEILQSVVWNRLQKETRETETRERLQLSLLWCIGSLLKKKKKKKSNVVHWHCWEEVLSADGISCQCSLTSSTPCTQFLLFMLSEVRLCWAPCLHYTLYNTGIRAIAITILSSLFFSKKKRSELRKKNSSTPLPLSFLMGWSMSVSYTHLTLPTMAVV